MDSHPSRCLSGCFFFNDTATTEIYTLSLHDALPISVAVAVGDVGDKLMAKLVPRVQALKVGPGLDPQSEMGPLVTRQHRDKVMGYVDQGVKEGAKLVVDGRGLKLQGYENGNFMGGCLFDNVTKDMTIYKDEIFGPVLSVV